MPGPDHAHDTVLVTGALGDVGSWVVDHLADDGTQVVGVDVDCPSGTRAGADFWAVDLTDRAAAWETVQQVDPDAVVHLAAVSDPMTNPDGRIFDNNVESTYNVLTAAGRAGVDVAWTSSQAAYGALFVESDWQPDYLPIDEAHDRRPEDAYGLSKVCGEEIAETVARRHGVSVTTIRPATVFTPDDTKARPARDNADLCTDETGGDFGSYVDVRDLARMIEAALSADHDGHEAVICAADENHVGRPTRELVEAICGSLPEDCRLTGRESALSNEKARELLGWTPRFGRPSAESEDATEPTWT